MGITELLSKIGDANVLVQNLAQSFVSSKKVKRGVNVTFGTNQITDAELLDGKISKIALIVWFDRDKLPKELTQTNPNE